MTERHMARLGSDLPDPGRTPGRRHGILLVSLSCLPVLGAVSLAPIQPQMQDAFADTPGVDILVPLTVTAPALMIGALALVAGRVIDRVGRIRLLTVALVVYSLFGVAPFFLDSLPLIVASRLGVGVAEAAIMTCCTTLIADYFEGTERARWFGLQVVFTSLSAVVFIGAGGALAQNDWRFPFWLYTVGILFAIIAPLVLWQPRSTATVHRTGAPVHWRPLLVPLAVTLFGGAVFYAPIVQIPITLDAVGVDNAGTIGAVSAVVAVATALAAFTFGRVSGAGPKVLLPIAFGASGVGLAMVGLAATPLLVAAGGIVASAGCGLLLPTLLLAVVSDLDFAQRARGTGAWTAAMFSGEFASPLVVVALGAVFGGLGSALVAFGAAAVLLAVLVPTLAAFPDVKAPSHS
ncbi:MFS transporter [Rhodococcus sp. BP-241]|nr:MFS transporter [Rhodococcus sp. BP-241]